MHSRKSKHATANYRVLTNILQYIHSLLHHSFQHNLHQNIHHLRHHKQKLADMIFMIQLIDLCLFEKMIGQDQTTLMGLPMIQLCHILRQLDLQIP